MAFEQTMENNFVCQFNQNEVFCRLTNKPQWWRVLPQCCHPNPQWRVAPEYFLLYRILRAFVFVHSQLIGALPLWRFEMVKIKHFHPCDNSVLAILLFIICVYHASSLDSESCNHNGDDHWSWRLWFMFIIMPPIIIIQIKWIQSLLTCWPSASW